MFQHPFSDSESDVYDSFYHDWADYEGTLELKYHHDGDMEIVYYLNNQIHSDFKGNEPDIFAHYNLLYTEHTTDDLLVAANKRIFGTP